MNTCDKWVVHFHLKVNQFHFWTALTVKNNFPLSTLHFLNMFCSTISTPPEIWIPLWATHIAHAISSMWVLPSLMHIKTFLGLSWWSIRAVMVEKVFNKEESQSCFTSLMFGISFQIPPHSHLRYYLLLPPNRNFSPETLFLIDDCLPRDNHFRKTTSHVLFYYQLDLPLLFPYHSVLFPLPVPGSNSNLYDIFLHLNASSLARNKCLINSLSI